MGPISITEYRAALDRLGAGKQVHFMETQATTRSCTAYRRARVAVLPSVEKSVYGHASPNSELLGLVLLEAMACGTPVVASALGGMPEVVRHGETGLLVQPGDSDELRESVMTLLDDTRLWSLMSGAAVELVREEFTWDRVAERCLDAYSAATPSRAGWRRGPSLVRMWTLSGFCRRRHRERGQLSCLARQAVREAVRQRAC